MTVLLVVLVLSMSDPSTLPELMEQTCLAVHLGL